MPENFGHALSERRHDPRERMSAVKLDNISKWFDRQDGAPLHVLHDIDIEVPALAIVAILGASGCGKSTILNIIAGMVEPDRGAVFLDDIPSHEFTDWRSMTYMFQEDRLLPWRTAAQNVGFGLEAAGVRAAERRSRVLDTLDLVGLADFADVFPHELSGGMRSRVALARSLVTEPSIILMDEPFSRLDPSIRAQMHAEVLRIAALRAMTVIFVTHDVEEAVVMANQVIVLHPRPGRVGEVRDIELPYPRDPVDSDVSEEVRSLRLSLASLSEAAC